MGLPVHLAPTRPSAVQGEEAGHPVASRAGLGYEPCRVPCCAPEARPDVAVACQGVAQILEWPSFRFSPIHHSGCWPWSALALLWHALPRGDGRDRSRRNRQGGTDTVSVSNQPVCDKAWADGRSRVNVSRADEVGVPGAKGGGGCIVGASTRSMGWSSPVATEAIAVD